MKIKYLRITEFAAATVVSSAVLLVAVTPAVFGISARAGDASVNGPHASVAVVERAPSWLKIA